MNSILLAIAALSLAPIAYAGVPSAHQAENAKWMRVSGNWTVDTEDIEVRVIRSASGFGVIRQATRK